MVHRALLFLGCFLFLITPSCTPEPRPPRPATGSEDQDIAPPKTRIEGGPEGSVTSPEATFTFSCDKEQCTFECRLDGGAWETCASPKTYTSIEDGQHTFEVRAIDAEGRVDPDRASRTWTVKASLETAIDSGPSGVVGTRDASFSFSCNKSPCTFECRLTADGTAGAWTSCSSPKSYASLSDASYLFEVRAYDPAHEVDATPASRTWSVDTVTPPESTISSGPSGLVNTTVATFSFACTKGACTYECRLTAAGVPGAWVACTSPKTYSSLADAAYKFEVRAYDAALNVDASPASRAWTVDTAPVDPNTPRIVSTSVDTAQAGATISLSGYSFGITQGTSTVTVGGLEAQVIAWSATSIQLTIPQLLNGRHGIAVTVNGVQSNDFEVRIFRALSLVAAKTRSPAFVMLGFEVLDESGEPLTGLNLSDFKIYEDGVIVSAAEAASNILDFEWETLLLLDMSASVLNGDNLFSLIEAARAYVDAVNGAHAVSIRIFDGRADFDPGVWVDFTRDRKALHAFLDSLAIYDGVDPVTDLYGAYVNGLALMEQRIANAPAQLRKGSIVVFTDGADNAGRHTLSFTKDAIASSVVDVYSVALHTPDLNMSALSSLSKNGIFVAADNAALQAEFQASAAQIEASRAHHYVIGYCSPKRSGSHTISVVLDDGVNQGMASYTLDATGFGAGCNGSSILNSYVDAKFVTKPGALTFGNVMTFDQVKGVAYYECRLDGGAWFICESPLSLGTLSPGAHSVEIRPVDAAGNTDPSPYVTTVTMADTTFTATPERVISTTSASISYTSNAVNVQRFECRQAESQPWSTCYYNPINFYSLAEGTYTVEVRAVDSDENVDTTPAKFTWTVDLSWQWFSAGLSHTCEILDGALFCWGANNQGQIGDGTSGSLAEKYSRTQIGAATNWTDVAAGGYHTCAINALGKLYCWGASPGNGAGATIISPWQVGSATDWQSIALGLSHSCAVKTSGALYCWGVNTNGQLGDGTTANKTSPIQIGVATDWRRVVGGEKHTCALKKSGALYCWGYNYSGQLGDGSTTSKTTPTQVGTATDWLDVSAGNFHTCGVKVTNELYCWGDNAYGQFGDGTQTAQLSPRFISGGWQRASAGGEHSCAVATDGSAFCWGRNEYGQLGDGTVVLKRTPVQVGSVTGWQRLELGGAHSCARNTSGATYCWGNNTWSPLGDGVTADKVSPALVDAATDWQSVSAGWQHACAVKSGGSLYCWGANQNGQLGDGTLTNRASPVRVDAATDWRSVSAGGKFTCAVKTGGGLFCWGGNASAPQQVSTSTDWQSVTVAPTDALHQCAVKTTGALYCWTGISLGEGSRVGTGLDWQNVDAGKAYTCAVTTNGTLYCWGGYYDMPTQVGTDTDWLRVSAGENATCAMKTPGAIYCWGNGGAVVTPEQAGTASDWRQLAVGNFGACAVNAEGALFCWGIGAPPAQVGTDTDWSSVTRGLDSYCAIKANGSLYCWGLNDMGQVGDGTAWRTRPVLVVGPL